MSRKIIQALGSHAKAGGRDSQYLWPVQSSIGVGRRTRGEVFKGPYSRHQGFTVLESMIAITIAAILLTVGVPSIRTFKANNQITATTNSILTGLNLARFSAVMRGENVLVCPSANSTSCSHGNWYRGWIVYVESGASNEADGFTPAEANVIRAVNIQPGPEAEKLKQDTGFTDTIVFGDDGTTSGSAAMVIDVCYGNTGITKRHRQVTISPFGPVSSSSVATVCS